MDQFARRLKSRGVTLTPQRIAILEYLSKSMEHPSVDEIHLMIKKKYPTMSKATVYSALKLFSTLGEIRELSIRKRGEVCYDPDPLPHHHFLCKECGRISHIKLDCPEDCPVLNSKKVNGFAIEEVQAYFYGVCPGCAGESRG